MLGTVCSSAYVLIFELFIFAHKMVCRILICYPILQNIRWEHCYFPIEYFMPISPV